MADSPDLMPIGAFSSLARLSVRMLRHYDLHGVLVPADVDDVTGRRRYASRQLADAADIRRLRDVGFGVSALSALLATRGTATYAQALRLQRDTLVADLRMAQQRLTALDALIAETGAPAHTEELTMPITVSTGRLPAMTVVALRGTVPSYADEDQLWQRFLPEVERQGVRLIGPGGCVEHDADYVESGPDESVWAPVAPGTHVQAPLEVVDLPEQPTVVATVTGAYAQISDAHRRIGEFLAAEGLVEAERDDDGLRGKVVNVYVTDPSTTPEPHLVTEVHRPIRRSGEAR